MAFPPLKSEQYQNLGGKNAKASAFMLGTNEVLDILNFSFITPGSYVPRPGTTPLISGFTYAINSFTEFAQLSGASYKIFQAGSTLFSFAGGTASPIRALGNVSLTSTLFGYTIAAGTPFAQGGTNSNLSLVPFVNRLFCAGGFGVSGGGDFFKTDGVNSYNYSLPGIDLAGLSTFQEYFGSATSGWTGWYQYTFCWLNERGYIGPIYQPGASYTENSNPQFALGQQAISFGASSSTAITILFNSVLASLVPQGFGITACVVFRSQAASANPFTSVINNLYDLAVIPLSSTSFTDNGATYGPASAVGNTLFSQSLFFTNIPRVVDVYNNAFMMFGFSSLPSTVYFSDTSRGAEPELIGNTAFIEFRTNDSDILTAGKNFLGQYSLFKTRSMFSLSGTGFPYNNSQISGEYGCLSARAVVTYEQYMMFLDRKGLAQYDGANLNIISNRVEPTFRRMNYQAALNTAVMLHVKDRNEIWCAFPIDGATTNNHMVVYDYVANAFTEWRGPRIASLGLATDPTQFLTPFFGNYSGIVQYFNASLFTDNGIPFTCMVMPRYFGNQGQEMGYSVEKMFRRLYLNMFDPYNTGQTSAFQFNLMADGSTTVSQTQTFSITGNGATQTRLDFGIPGKAMTFQMFYVPQTPALQFSGFTVEYRFQRNV